VNVRRIEFHMADANRPIFPDLSGKVALVTGIGQDGPADNEVWGNGAAIALALAQNGAKVFGCDINLEAGQSTVSRIRKIIPDAEIDVVSTDVTKATAVEDLVKQCMTKHSRIDILVNNVGRSERGDPASMSEDVWDAQVDVNLKSVYLTTHLVLPIMEAQGSGAIVNISSIVSMRYAGKPQVAYSAMKSAITAFTKHTAVVYAKKGIRLNVVVPGLMFTPLVATLAKKYAGGDYEGYVQTRHDQVPTGKMGSAHDVANAVAFLSSNVAAGYITGQKLVVDGGITSSTGRT
jgi:NAD(P)-dependent dehydrogenase (short-subunit alcohol dehydrogenase family)